MYKRKGNFFIFYQCLGSKPTKGKLRMKINK